jgi:hypothetical protein
MSADYRPPQYDIVLVIMLVHTFSEVHIFSLPLCYSYVEYFIFSVIWRWSFAFKEEDGLWSYFEHLKLSGMTMSNIENYLMFWTISFAIFILKKEIAVLVKIYDNFQRFTCLIPDGLFCMLISSLTTWRTRSIVFCNIIEFGDPLLCHI